MGKRPTSKREIIVKPKEMEITCVQCGMTKTIEILPAPTYKYCDAPECAAEARREWMREYMREWRSQNKRRKRRKANSKPKKEADTE